MCIEFQNFRARTFSHVMGKLLDLVGLRSIWEVDLQLAPTVRAMAAAGRLGDLEYLLSTAMVNASKIGFVQAVGYLKTAQAQIAALKAELQALQVRTVSLDVAVLDSDWGKPGRAAKIIAWARSTNATAGEVASRYQLAISTARAYIRRAKPLAATRTRKRPAMKLAA